MASTIVVTGASGGIGAALARHLDSRGDRVVLAARLGPNGGEVRGTETEIQRRRARRSRRKRDEP